MLADLVNAGCVDEGSDATNNPLSRLGKAVLDAGRQSNISGGSSSQMDAALPSGPMASSSGLLPEMGPSEAAFMHAFEHDTMLQHQWEMAAAHGAPMPPPHMMPPMMQHAMAQGMPPPHMMPPMMQHAMAQGMPPPNMHPDLSDAFADAWAASAQAPPNASGPMNMQGVCMAPPPPHAQMMMRPIPPHPAFAPHFAPPPFHHLPAPPPVHQQVPQPHSAPAAAASTINPPRDGTLSASDVYKLDAAHEAAWQSLATPMTPAERAAMASESVPAAVAQMGNPRSARHMVRGDSNGSLENLLDASYAEVVLEGMAQESVASASVDAEAAAFAAAARAEDAAFETSAGLKDAYSEMEAVWKQLSLQERKATSQALGGLNTAGDFDHVWNSLKGGDYDTSWDQLWQEAGGADGLSQTSDAEAPYRFHADNPHLGGTNLLERGTELFRRGELSEAVLVLEAAVQQQPHDTLAWQTLGQTHADADDDAQAIACLRRAVAADPHNLDALLALGVSYTNELDQTRALKHLQLWLESHPDFAEIGLAADAATGATSAAAASPLDAFQNPFELQQKVTDLFLKAVEKRPQNADLHAVLGVLYNLSRSYPEAMASFEASLRLRPDDYSLWNKLGATQANAMSCTAAVPCYIKALELKPQYVRALSNLGISYGNMANYQAAAQCYLKALSLNSEAHHIWGYLTMTLTSMGRTDLLVKAAAADHEAFREVFDF